MVATVIKGANQEKKKKEFVLVFFLISIEDNFGINWLNSTNNFGINGLNSTNNLGINARNSTNVGLCN